MYSRHDTHTPSSVRRYRTTTEQPAAPEQYTSISKRQPLDVQVHHDYLMHTTVKARRSRVASPPTHSQERQTPLARSGFRLKFPSFHPLAYIGLTMCACLVLWVGGQTAINRWDDTIYGYPRIYQCDAVVGHADSPANPSHFIAINLYGRLEVIEFPGGDASHAKIYIGPELVGYGLDHVRVTLSFKDVNGDGHPDLLIHAGGRTFVFLNDKGTFRAATPADHGSQ
jgi:hypothetical protein